MYKISIIEIGTNSVKLLIAQVSDKTKVSPIQEKVVITRIGRNLGTTKRLDSKGARQTITLIKKFLKLCEQQKVNRIAILGTSALREASNSKNFIRQVKRITGVDLEIISLKQEAYLSYLGALSSTTSRNTKNLVIDIGGGSTEIAYGTSNKIEHAWNIPIGAVKLTERFTDKEYQQMMKYIKTKLAHISKSIRKPFITYGVGGTITTLASVDLHSVKLIPINNRIKQDLTENQFNQLNPVVQTKIQGYTLTRDKVNRLLNLFQKSTLTQREKIKGLEKDRADIILAGTAILLCLMDLLKINRLTVSTRGLRYGYLINKLNCSHHKVHKEHEE